MNSAKCVPLTILVIALVQMLRGDVLELTNGERLDGQLVAASRTSIVFEVAGNSIAVDTPKVRAIHLGTTSAALVSGQPSSSFEQACDEVRALNALVQTSIAYQDYNTQVIATQVRFEKLLGKVRDEVSSARIQALRDAMTAHNYAKATWSGKFATSQSLSEVAEEVKGNKNIIGCASGILNGSEKAEDVLSLPLKMGSVIRAGAMFTDPAIKLLWTCSSNLLATAAQTRGVRPGNDSIQDAPARQAMKDDGDAKGRPTTERSPAQIPGLKGLQGGPPPVGSKRYTIHGQ